MRIVYADTGLWQNVGHHANACRTLVGEWRARGHQVSIAGSRLIDDALRKELRVQPHFRVNTYEGADTDPICGWLTNFHHAATCTAEDLVALGPFAPDELLYVNSIMPAQLMALATFLGATPEIARPCVMAELGTGPGLDYTLSDGHLQFHAKDPRQDARSVLYRFAGRQLQDRRIETLHLVTFDRTCSAIYGALLGRQVTTVPLAYAVPGMVRSRVGTRPVTVAILGHQRGEKGYHLVPAIAEALLRGPEDVRLLLHNGAPQQMTGVQDEIRALACDVRVTVDERAADGEIWAELLGRSDLIVCPYHPQSYIGAYSAIIAEALAHAIPLVVPAGTTLARTLQEFGSPGAVFDGFDAASVAAATRSALAEFDLIALRATAASALWHATMGVARTIDSLEALLPSAQRSHSSTPHRDGPLMKLLFSNPPWWGGQSTALDAEGNTFETHIAGVRAGSRWPFTLQLRTAPDSFELGSYLPYPFFMGYATTYAARHTGSQVTFRDSIALRESYATYLGFLVTERFDMIVIESASPSWSHDEALIRTIKEHLPECRVVVTGPIASKGEELLRTAPIHACIRGEYEKGVVRVVGGESGLIDFDMLSEEEMNAAPFPYYDHTYAHRYIDANPRGFQFPQAQVWSSRGCPYKCIFCVWPATMTGNDPDGTGKRTVRHYGPDYMETYLTQLVQTYGYRSIYFDDDTFNLGDRHVERMCAVMRKLSVPWAAMCRADTSRLALWGEMKASGCYGVKIGFESGNQHVVDNIVNKRLDLEKARVAVAEMKRVRPYGAWHLHLWPAGRDSGADA